MRMETKVSAIKILSVCFAKTILSRLHCDHDSVWDLGRWSIHVNITLAIISEEIN